MQYLIRLIQVHEEFRRAEIEALSTLANVEVEVVYYESTLPFCIVEFPGVSESKEAATQFISRSFLTKGIYELWGQGVTYDELHQNVHDASKHLWPEVKHATFKFTIDAYCGRRSTAEQNDIINSFQYLGCEGGTSMKTPEAEFVIFEQWDLKESPHHQKVGRRSLLEHDEQVSAPTLLKTAATQHKPKNLYFTRLVASSQRHLIDKHSLKSRPYISTTSMDAELALVTATLALASPGKIFLDPFVGTGGFLLAAAELGAMTQGADIDGRSFRGEGAGLTTGIARNLEKYGLTHLFGDCITSDLVHSPWRIFDRRKDSSDRAIAPTKNLRPKRWLDGIITDPPYGVREGLKSLGTRKPYGKPRTEAPATNDAIDSTNPDTPTTSSDPSSRGPSTAPTPPTTSQIPYHPTLHIPSHKAPSYIAPKKPYSFDKMIANILTFAAETLVDHGRLALWMPTANDRDDEIGVPRHGELELLHVCTQPFNKWSRRLIVYRRKSDDEAETDAVDGRDCVQHADRNGEMLPGGESEIASGGVSSRSNGSDSYRDDRRTGSQTEEATGVRADDLNPFRRRYFQGFEKK